MLIKAFKKAAESLEKLLDVTREELPDTMAAVRLSGMEISDLTMELSDLGFVSYPTMITYSSHLFCNSFSICVAKVSLKVLKAQHGLFA